MPSYLPPRPARRRHRHRRRRRFSGQTRNGRYSWARYYHPGHQRFISEDPIEFAGGDANLYAYVSNNPASFTDPTGEIPTAVIGAVLGAAVGGLRAVYAGCGVSGFTEGVLKGAAVGTLAGLTFGAGLPLLTSAGLTGLAAFDVSLVVENTKNLVTGRKSPAGNVILSAAGEGVTAMTLSFVGGGLGRLAGDVAASVSPGFGVGISRFFSTGIGANSAIFVGPAQGLARPCL